MASTERVIVVERKGNGLGVAGFVCGLLGSLTGLIPLLVFLTFPLGILGVVFGLIGWRRTSADPERGSRKLSIAGALLGVAALALGVWGVVIIDDAFSAA